MSSHLLDTPAVTHTDDNTHTKNTTHLHVGTMLRAQVHKQGFQKKRKATWQEVHWNVSPSAPFSLSPFPRGSPSLLLINFFLNWMCVIMRKKRRKPVEIFQECILRRIEGRWVENLWCVPFTSEAGSLKRKIDVSVVVVVVVSMISCYQLLTALLCDSLSVKAA